MSARGFLSLVAGVMVFGGLLSGSFLSGLALGGDDSQEAVQVVLTVPSTANGDGQTSGATGRLSLDQIRQLQSGDLSLEELAQIRQQLGSGWRGPGGGLLGGDFTGGGLMGTVESVEGSTVTVNTSQGPLQAFVGPDTVIQRTTQVSIEEIVEGLRVTVSGERDESGIVEATSIFLLPEGAEGFAPGGFRGGRRGGP